MKLGTNLRVEISIEQETTSKGDTWSRVTNLIVKHLSLTSNRKVLGSTPVGVEAQHSEPAVSLNEKHL